MQTNFSAFGLKNLRKNGLGRIFNLTSFNFILIKKVQKKRFKRENSHQMVSLTPSLTEE